MIYWDTSVIIKLYVREMGSELIAKKAKEFDLSIPLTLFHEVEITNALQLKRFRNEIEAEQVKKIISLLRQHEENFIYHRPVVDWGDVFRKTIDLSQAFSGKIGSRSLDIFHVASACILNADSFFSNDAGQLSLAASAGLSTIGIEH